MTDTATRQAAADRELEHIKPYSWFVLTILCVIYIFNFLDRQLFATLGTFIAKDMHLSDADLGKLGGIYFAAFYTLIGIPVGWLADRTNRVRILFLACTIWSVATACCGLSTNFGQLAISRMTIGVGEAGGAPPSYSIISDYFPKKQRGTALAIFSLGVPLGQAAANAFGVSIASTIGWKYAFYGLGAMGVVAAVALIVLVREPKRGAKEAVDIHMEEAPAISLAEEKAKLLPTMREFFGRPAMLFTALSCGAAAFVAYGVLNFTVNLLRGDKHIPDGQLALWYSLELAIIGSFGVWLSGYLVDKLRSRGNAWYAIVPAVGFTVVIPFYLGFVWAPDWQTSVAFLTIPVLLNTFYLAPALAVVQNTMRPSQRTMAGALLLLVLNLVGLGLGPTFVGMMSTDVFLPKVTEAYTLAHGMAPVGKALAAVKAEGLRDAMYSLTPFYLIAVGFHLVAALLHRQERLHGAPSENALDRNAILVKFAIGIVGAALIWKFGPAIVWFKDLIYAVFAVFIILGVVDIARGRWKAG
jgi:predicted MFS family arabinose efflux permease